MAEADTSKSQAGKSEPPTGDGATMLVVSLLILVLCLGLYSLPATHVLSKYLSSETLGAPLAEKPLRLEATATKEELRFQFALKEVLGTGKRAWVKHLESVEAPIWQTYQALPQNAHGRLGVRATRYILWKHLGKEHGWLVKGLEPHGYRRSISKSVHDVAIIAEKTPVLAHALSDARPADHGYSYGDIVAIFAAMERLILDETIQLLESAYQLNNRPLNASLGDKAMQEVLLSYLMNILGGVSKLHSDRKWHQQAKQNKSKHDSPSATNWKEMVMFQRDVLHNYLYDYKRSVNPFIPRQLSYKAAQQVGEQIAIQFGRWQDVECRQIKADLVKLDRHGTGRVALGMFYKRPNQFSENIDYLRSVGALDETVPKQPMVIIPNYMYAPCNCIATFKYHTFCCFNECETIMSEIESSVNAPFANGKHLLTIVATNISSTSVDAPRILPHLLVDKMHGITEHYEGLVPIHGRLFQQWLHYAFPRECPYPYIAKSATVMTREHFSSGSFTASLEDMQYHAKSVNEVKSVRPPYLSQWANVEVLPIHDQDFKESSRTVYSSGIAVHFVVLTLSLLCVVLSICFLLRRSSTSNNTESRKRDKAKTANQNFLYRIISSITSDLSGVLPAVVGLAWEALGQIPGHISGCVYRMLTEAKGLAYPVSVQSSPTLQGRWREFVPK